MEAVRTRYQGLWNVIRFNWHFYAAAGAAVILLLAVLPLLTPLGQCFMGLVVFGILLATGLSLAVTYYVYDGSALYQLRWLDELKTGNQAVVVNVSAGFDEVSEILEMKFPEAQLQVWDFYDPQQHTEISIKRARAAYPSHELTQVVETEALPMGDSQADLLCLHMAAHEIRDHDQRVIFFAELHRILRDEGRLCVTEHLRDLPNFMVYNLGALHFYPKTEWLEVFDSAGFEVLKERKETAFVSTFVLKKK
ncbi:MAG: methyltransferase domain-containing protein [Verrucomicrobiota bacterium]